MENHDPAGISIYKMAAVTNTKIGKIEYSQTLAMSQKIRALGGFNGRRELRRLASAEDGAVMGASNNERLLP